ncbi:MAG: arylamine N-acetyltransferase [Nitrospira sp.]|nr:arylamine N-acetyltransferase [Nitrospira sp.]
MDIHSYYDRIAYRGTQAVSPDALRALHLAHVLTVPFENLDNFLGRAISLEPADLFAKIVTAKRGGYCFELNGLFSLLLEELGFSVTRLIARVRYGAKPPYPKSHQVSMVNVGGESWLVDVGFGGNGLLEPIRLSSGVQVAQYSEEFRLTVIESDEYLLQCLVHEEWESLYSFTLEPCQPVDYLYPNYFHSHSPDSRFMQRRICTIPTKDGRKTLVDRRLSIRQDGQNEKSVVEGDAAYTRALHEHFGLVLP